MNYFDGAEAIKSKDNKSSVISFSSQIFSTNQIQEKKVAAGSSFNILTWLQVIGKEKIDLLKIVGSDYLTARKKIVEGSLTIPSCPNSKLWCYDVHDGKMHYELTQHSKWNRKYCPNLLCYCQKGDGLKSNHTCELMTRDDNKWYVAQSKAVWDRNETSHDALKYRDWADAENWGVTHFGVSPEEYPLDTLRYDTFHMSCSILRKVMESVRDVVDVMSHQLKLDFTDEVLRTFFKDWHLYTWNCGFAFTRFEGKDLFRWLDNIEKVTAFLTNRMGESRRVSQLVVSLELLPTIFSFITTSYIEESDVIYLERLRQFKKDCLEFAKNGRLTFLVDERDETMYVHTLCHYLPLHAKVTFERHRLGLGIFTMQGFERRNKESKNCIRRFSTGNRKSFSFLVNNVRRLLNIFVHETKAA